MKDTDVKAENKGEQVNHWILIHEEFREFYSSPCSMNEFDEDLEKDTGKQFS